MVIEMKEEQLISSTKAAVSGLVTDDVMAVAVGWDGLKSHLTLRYYFSHEPSEQDKELCSSALAELEAEYWREIKTAEDQCVYVSDMNANLDQLDGFGYLRREKI
jgi:hypothetical protein